MYSSGYRDAGGIYREGEAVPHAAWGTAPRFLLYA